MNYAIGGDVQLLPSQQLTVSFELVGAEYRDAIESDDPVAYGPLTINDPRFTPPAVTRLTNTEPIFRETSINVMRAALGAKILLGERVLLSGGVTMPVGEDGLRAGVSPDIGVPTSAGRPPGSYRRPDAGADTVRGRRARRRDSRTVRYRCEACGGGATWRPSTQQVICRSCDTVCAAAPSRRDRCRPRRSSHS